MEPSAPSPTWPRLRRLGDSLGLWSGRLRATGDDLRLRSGATARSRYSRKDDPIATIFRNVAITSLQRRQRVQFTGRGRSAPMVLEPMKS